MHPERRSKWLLAWRRSATPARRLFCFPYAGGGASIYRRVTEHVAIDTEVCAVQLPGREDRYLEPAYVRLETLIPVLASEIRASLDRPFAFFGHSMGTLIAFELARELRRRGDPLPAHLFLSGRRAPPLSGQRRQLHTLDDRELDIELRSLGGTPAEVLDDPGLMDLVRPVLRADCELCETYALRQEPPLDIPFAVFGGTDDVEALPEQLEAWRNHTRAAVSVRLFPGHHFYLHDQWPALARDIDEAFAATPSPR